MTTGVSQTNVLIVGAGPTGLLLANLLGGMGVDVTIVERNEGLVTEPRAVSIDDESMRALQAAGLADRAQDVTARGYGSIYLGPTGRPYARVMPISRDYGWDKRNAFEQPVLDSIPRDGLGRFDNVVARFGCEVTDFDSRGDENVEVTLREAEGGETRIRARYMVACDGGRSPVRKALAIKMEGSTYAEPWLSVDLERSANLNRHTEVHCDTKRPCITLTGPDGIRRYEFMLMPGEDPEALRDAHNLAWKPDEALRAGPGAAAERILDSDQAERKPHADEMIRLALVMGRVMMPTSQIKGALYRAGLIWPDGRPEKRTLIGQMLSQPEIEDRSRKRMLLDEVLPDKPVAIVFDDRPGEVLSGANLARLGEAGATVVEILPEWQSGAGGLFGLQGCGASHVEAALPGLSRARPSLAPRPIRRRRLPINEAGSLARSVSDLAPGQTWITPEERQPDSPETR